MTTSTAMVVKCDASGCSRKHLVDTGSSADAERHAEKSGWIEYDLVPFYGIRMHFCSQKCRTKFLAQTGEDE